MLSHTPPCIATLLRKVLLPSALALAFGFQTAHAAVAPNFTITNHITGKPLTLYDYQGSVIVLDFWAYWCGPCNSASADIEPNVAKYYANAGGNPYGVPVTVISISIDMSDPAGENAFIQDYGLQLVGDDPNGVAFGTYDVGYIPQFVVINGLTNSANTGAWKILFNQDGYATNSTVPQIKSAINSVQAAPTGSLKVTLSPAGAVSAGAKWEVDGGTPQSSGATVTNLSVGAHTVSFTTISGWTTPANQTVSVSTNSTATASGTYVAIPQFGSLQVTLSPAGAVSAGAKWEVDGGTPQSSGATVTNLSVGTHTVSFTTISGWTTPSNQTVSVSANSTATASGSYVQQFGSLQVTLSPAAAVTAGAQWQVDGGTPQSSGATVANLSVGAHTVSFTTISGWTTPANQTVSVSANSTATASGSYVQQFGSLQVTLSPAAAVTAGAQWQVDGGTPQSSGATVANLSAGAHTVSFTTISGWTTPANQTVSVSANSTATASGTYVAIPQFGSLQVTLSPAGAVSAGAKWEVDGGTPQSSGATVANLLVGAHTVSFTTISGWTTPSNQTVSVSTNSTATASGSYVQQFGSLQVTLSPAAAVAAGAQWQVDGGTPQSSGATVANLSVGAHLVTFTAIAGWTTPANEGVDVSANATATASGTYVAIQQTGSLQVTLSPAAAVTAGAKWQVDGGTPQSSGATVANLSAGNHTVSFTTISGWTTPANQTVSVSANSTASGSGTYVAAPQTGSLQVTLSPAGAVSAGAKWEVDGGTPQSSGATVANLSAGAHTVSFTTISGWTTPSNQTVSVSTNSTATARGNYVQQFGSLQATLSPAAAVASGAKWQVDGGAWQKNGVTVTNLSVGSHSVSFNAITGWITPANQSVSISNNLTTTASGTYAPQPGSLEVTITPAGAITSGAQWQVDDGPLQNSGTTVSNLSPTNHTVSFSTIFGWTTPSNQTVSVKANSTAKATGTYVAQPGSLTVNISPPAAVTNGAKWQVDGGKWQNGGATVTNLAPGILNHKLSFNTINGWITPPNQTVSISNDLTTTAGGTYVVQTGSLQVTLSPAAITNVAKWQVDYGTWQNSGATVANLAGGQSYGELQGH